MTPFTSGSILVLKLYFIANLLYMQMRKLIAKNKKTLLRIFTNVMEKWLKYNSGLSLCEIPLNIDPEVYQSYCINPYEWLDNFYI